MAQCAQSFQDNIKCPNCKEAMVFNRKDNFYRCPACKGQYWPNENTMPCPGCGRPMRINKTFGFHKCIGCGSEFWPPDTDGSDEEQKEDDPSTWKCSPVYAGEHISIKGGSKASGRKKKKKRQAGLFGDAFGLV